MKAVGWLMGIAASAVILELVFWSKGSRVPPPGYARVGTATTPGAQAAMTAYYYPDGRVWLLPPVGTGFWMSKVSGVNWSLS